MKTRKSTIVKLLTNWHSGQNSASYQFLSSNGAFVANNASGYIKESYSNLIHAESLITDTMCGRKLYNAHQKNYRECLLIFNWFCFLVIEKMHNTDKDYK